MGARIRFSVATGLFIIPLLIVALQFGSIGGCGSGAVGGGGGGGDGAGGDEGTRSLTGALPVSLPAPLTLRGKSQATDLACTDIQVCCVEYGSTEATPTAIDAGTDCSFTLSLPLNTFYACHLASGTDDDGDGCKDTYVGSMGCFADGFSGGIPIFPGTDGGTDDIDLGTSSVEGHKMVTANDPCAQVDQDQDGAADSEDSDDDGDGTDDADDVFNGAVCADLCKMDGNENDVPDCYELGDVAAGGTSDSFFDVFFADSDGDNTPDGCDADIGCSSNDDDANGDCIPDAFIFSNNSYTVGGTVLGLGAGKSVVLQNNGGDDNTVSADGTFTFTTSVTEGGTYNVTVGSQPSGQTCVVSNGSGTTADANVTDVSVVCTHNSYTVGGTVSGLGAGKSVILNNNGTENNNVTANGSFTFTTSVADGGTYNVTVNTQPSGQTCLVSNESGTIVAANVTNISAVCTDNSYTVGGTISGLIGGTAILLNNGGNNLNLSVNGAFTFTSYIAEGSSYNVTIFTNPPGQICTIANESGTIAGANINNVSVTCTP